MTINILGLAREATWKSGQLLNHPDIPTGEKTLGWADKANERLGYANFGEWTLENGEKRDVLFMHPKWVEKGTIKGWFPWRKLPANARLEIEVGLSKGANNTDGVNFQVWEHHEVRGRKVWHRIINAHKKYTGSLKRITADLSHLSGQSVGFELRVDAGNTHSYDWACWPKVKVVQGSASGGSVSVSRQEKRSYERTLSNSTERPRPGHICNVQKRTASVTAKEHMILDPQSHFIWPGALVLASSVATGEYKPALISQDRLPISISISDINRKSLSHQTVDEPSLSTVREIIRQFHHSGSRGIPAKMDSRFESIYSKEHFNIAFKGHYKSGVDKITAGLSFDSKTTKNKLVMDFSQVYYTIDVSTLPNRFFEMPISGDDVAYIASVTYGRRVMFLMESDESVVNMKAALGYASGSAFNADLKAKYENTLKTSSIQALVLGGNTEKAANIVSNVDGKKGIQDVMNYIRSGAGGGVSSPPVPLAYKLCYLSDGAVANVTLSTNYTLRKCQKSRGTFSVVFTKIVLISWDDPADLGPTEEIYGSFEVKAYKRPGALLGSKVLWNKNRDNYVSLYSQSEFEDEKGKPSAAEIGEEVRFTFEDFHEVIDTGYFEIVGTIKERDFVIFDFEGIHDDDYGPGEQTKRVYLRDAIMPSGYDRDKVRADGRPDNSPSSHDSRFKLLFHSGNAKVEMRFEVNPID